MDYAVIGEHNTWFGDEDEQSRYPRPKVYGVAVEVMTGTIYPATFPEQSPDPILRHARLSFRQFQTYAEYERERDIFYEDFDDTTGHFVIKPFHFQRIMELPFICKASDNFILENMSTSPLVEPDHFCNHIREAAKIVLDHKDPFKTLFNGGKPRTYVFSENEKKWIRVKVT